MKIAFLKYSPIALAAGALGFVSTFSQLYLLREFMAVFYGNEILIGILLFSWIFLSGLGSFMAIHLEKYKAPIHLICVGFLLLAVFPMVSYVLLALLYPLFQHHGEIASLTSITIIAMLVLAPVCLLNGILFSLFAQVFQKTDLISKNYAFESLGGLIGGIVIYYWSGNDVEATNALLVLGILVIIFCLLIAWPLVHFKRILIGGITALFILFGLAQTQPGEQIKRNTYGIQKIMLQKNTNSGKLTVTKLGGQLNIYLNGFLWYNTGESVAYEEATHFILSQRSIMGNVLLIGGGMTTLPREILKYKPNRLDYTEVVPELVDFSVIHNKILSNPSIVCRKGEIYNLLQTSDRLYDKIIVNIPEPYSAAVNRYYTTNFFTKARQQLTPDGIISFSLPLNKDSKFQPTVYHTLKSLFLHVEIKTGNRNYFLASNGPVASGVIALCKGEKLNFMNANNLNDSAFPINRTDLRNSISMPYDILNSELEPSSNLGQINYWISHFGQKNWVLIGIAALFFAYFIYKLNGVGRSVFITGFSCLALEMVIMVIYQSLCGTIYRGSGIIISVFMGGMSLGFWIKLPATLNSKKWFSNVLLILSVICSLPIFIVGCNFFSIGFYSLIAVALLLIGFIFSFFTGLLFSLGVSIGKGSIGQIVAKTYGADMLGASLGALLVSSYLIPQFGVQTVGCILFVMLFLPGIILKFSK